MSGSVGWNFTVHGVRGWPTSVDTTSLLSKSTTLTVWSPCVDAKRRWSAEKATLIVDFVDLGRSKYSATQSLAVLNSANSARKMRSAYWRQLWHATMAPKPAG